MHISVGAEYSHDALVQPFDDLYICTIYPGTCHLFSWSVEPWFLVLWFCFHYWNTLHHLTELWFRLCRLLSQHSTSIRPPIGRFVNSVQFSLILALITCICRQSQRLNLRHGPSLVRRWCGGFTRLRERAFSVACPSAWAQSLPTFRRHLKTSYSQSAYPRSAVHLA